LEKIPSTWEVTECFGPTTVANYGKMKNLDFFLTEYKKSNLYYSSWASSGKVD